MARGTECTQRRQRRQLSQTTWRQRRMNKLHDLELDHPSVYRSGLICPSPHLSRTSVRCVPEHTTNATRASASPYACLTFDGCEFVVFHDERLEGCWWSYQTPPLSEHLTTDPTTRTMSMSSTAISTPTRTCYEESMIIKVSPSPYQRFGNFSCHDPQDPRSKIIP